MLRIREGMEEEYVEAHRNVWPDLIQHLQDVGFHNYSIFKRGLDLFVYVEVEDFEQSLEALVTHPLSTKNGPKKWSPSWKNIRPAGKARCFPF